MVHVFPLLLQLRYRYNTEAERIDKYLDICLRLIVLLVVDHGLSIEEHATYEATTATRPSDLPPYVLSERPVRLKQDTGTSQILA